MDPHSNRIRTKTNEMSNSPKQVQYRYDIVSKIIGYTDRKKTVVHSHNTLLPYDKAAYNKVNKTNNTHGTKNYNITNGINSRNSFS